MKVYIENSDKNSNELGGKSLFCNRLAKSLRKKGVHVFSDSKIKVDVSLNVIRINHNNSKIKLLRLDGIWHDTGKNFKEKNLAIKINLQKANGVIYQSYFSEQMGNKYLGKASCPVKVICNGSDPSFYEDIKPIRIKKIIIMAISKWRPHKRLRDIIESFLLAEIKNSILVIAGDTLRSELTEKEIYKYKQNNKIKFLGHVDQKILASYLKAASASIHLCWFDSCPNSVIESIVAGIPVICNNVGGTWEIVGAAGGYVLPLDDPYDMNPVDLYHPPEINRGRIAAALIDCIRKKPKMINKNVLIDNIADQYLKFMKELLCQI